MKVALTNKIAYLHNPAAVTYEVFCITHRAVINQSCKPLNKSKKNELIPHILSDIFRGSF